MGSAIPGSLKRSPSDAGFDFEVEAEDKVDPKDKASASSFGGLSSEISKQSSGLSTSDIARTSGTAASDGRICPIDGCVEPPRKKKRKLCVSHDKAKENIQKEAIKGSTAEHPTRLSTRSSAARLSLATWTSRRLPCPTTSKRSQTAKRRTRRNAAVFLSFST